MFSKLRLSNFIHKKDTFQTLKSCQLLNNDWELMLDFHEHIN